MFDMLTMLKIDIIAVRMAIEKNPDVPPCTLFDDELLGAAIAVHFSDDPDWRDDLRAPALATYRQTQTVQDSAQAAAARLLDAHYVWRGADADC